MSRSTLLTLAICCHIPVSQLLAADPPTVPDVVYIDPAPYLPEGMDQMVDEALRNIPLSDLVDHIEERYGLAVRLQEDDLSDAGLTFDEEVDFPAGVPLYQALAVALEDVAGTQLTWVMEDGILKITTEDDAFDRHQVRVYDMPLLDDGLDAQSQIDFIQGFTNGEWMNSIGGEIDSAGNILVMRQTQRVHLETQLLLDALSRDGRIVRIEHPPNHQRLFEALDQTVDVDIDSQPLEQALARISDQLDVPIRMRVSALQDAGIVPEDLVSYHLGARPLRSVFKHLLSDVSGTELTYLIADGMFCITTADDAVDRYELALYDVRDLLRVIPISDLLNLVDAHTSDNWYDDGIGGDYGILPNGCMTIRHTAAVHEEIVTLLSLIREKLVIQPAVGIDLAAFEVRLYYVNTATADRLERLLPELIAPESWSIDGNRDGAWISRVRLPENWGPRTSGGGIGFGGGIGGFGGGGGGGFFQVPIGPAIRAAESLPTFQGFGGGMYCATSNTPYHNEVALIIRQSIGVHEQIADFIEEPGSRLRRGESNYQIGPRSPVSESDAAVRSDVLNDPDWLAADRIDPWQTMSEMPELEIGYVDAAAFVPDMMRQVLEEPIVDVPILTVAEYIVREFGIRVSVGLDDLADAGLADDELVTMPGGLPLYMALDQGLRDVAGTQLEWYFDDDILTISTPEVTADLREPMAYDVGDLLAPNDDGQWLIDFLQDQTSGAWQDMDGVGGAADIVGNVLLVTQEPRIQREVGSLVDALRVDAIAVRTMNATNASLFAALDQPVAIEFETLPLARVIEDLSTQTGVPFHIRESALQDAGVTPDDEVAYQQGERPLRQVLNLMLEDVAGTQLAYIVENGAINITTEDDAVDRFVVTLYQVSDILNAMPLVDGRPDYQALIDLVQSQSSGEWMDIDGIGGELNALPGGRIAVRNTQQVHEKITHLFTDLREHLKPRTETHFDPAAVETRYYRLLSTTADDLQRELPRLFAPESWRSEERPEAVGVIHHFDITGPEPNNQQGFFQVDQDSSPEKPDKDLPEAEPPPTYTWLVITQTAGTHRRIAALLQELATGEPASSLSWDRVDVEGVLSEVIKP